MAAEDKVGPVCEGNKAGWGSKLWHLRTPRITYGTNKKMMKLIIVEIRWRLWEGFRQQWFLRQVKLYWNTNVYKTFMVSSSIFQLHIKMNKLLFPSYSHCLNRKRPILFHRHSLMHITSRKEGITLLLPSKGCRCMKYGPIMEAGVPVVFPSPTYYVIELTHLK